MLVLSYGGVLLAPARAIHMITDPSEPQLAGNWRGLFPHKNSAGAAMAHLIFIGLLVFNARSRAVGLAMIVASLVFLLFTQAKTSMGLLPVVLGLSWIIMRLRSGWARVVFALSLIGLINLFTVGTVVIPAVRTIVEALASDPTYTNRTDIWQHAVAAIQQRPWLGHGFQAFWQTDATVFGAAAEAWVARMPDGHNGYVDLALSAGLPAVVMATIWLVARPMLSLTESERAGGHSALDVFFVRTWLFGMLLSALESVLFAGGGVSWFMVLVGVFGLRMQARARPSNG